MASYEDETTRDREPSLRDRLATLEKITANFGERLEQMETMTRRLVREVGIDGRR